MADRIMIVLVGAAGFWIPVVLLETLSRGHYRISTVSVVPVVCTLGVLWLLRRVRIERFRMLSLYMLAGIYLLCPLAIMIAGSSFGGGFAVSTGGHSILWLLLASIFPPLAWMLAGYNGTIFGLLAVTIVLVAVAMPKKRGAPAGESQI